MVDKMEQQKIKDNCEFYSSMSDNFGEIVLEHCTSPLNTVQDTEGNCTRNLCPLKLLGSIPEPAKLEPREVRESKEDTEFTLWWNAVGKHAMPNQEDIPPKHYLNYRVAARMAWQELACRNRTEVSQLKFQDHEIREFVNHLTSTARTSGQAGCARELMSRVVHEFLHKQMR